MSALHELRCIVLTEPEDAQDVEEADFDGGAGSGDVLHGEVKDEPVGFGLNCRL